MNKKSDFLVIGGGIAGLSFALQVAKLGQVNLLLKDEFELSATQLAQGGINAALGESDSFESHRQDTQECGYGLCDAQIVKQVVELAPQAIEKLQQYGTDFTRQGKQLSLHREGGHSHHRVVHKDDASGAAIMQALKQQVAAHPDIHVYTHHIAIDLILEYPAGSHLISDQARAIGAYVLDEQHNEVDVFLAKVTYLATGGIGKVYQYTSNPSTATGDGMAMAARIGLEMVNMEFVQFHPTVLYHPEAQSFLITEALRGEGGHLLNTKGERFMRHYHPQQMELAPRDIVARAIDTEIKKSGDPCVFLDLSHLNESSLINGYPTIYQRLLALGIDFTRQAIPVVPAAHYACGGLSVDEWGQTRCPGLYAGGECVHTGLHGANRLASNSLLEAAVYAQLSAEHIRNNPNLLDYQLNKSVADWVYHNYSDEYEESLVHPLWAEVRQFMWNYVGIIRTDKRLERARHRIKYLREEIESSYWNFSISRDLIELRNIAIVADLIIKSASQRQESRGAHFNADHQSSSDQFKKNTCIISERYGVFRS